VEKIFIVAVGVPFIIFMLVVAPTWLILHYRSKKYLNQGLSAEESDSLQALADRAEKMTERIHTLESILDTEAPEWRKKL
jgi:phage shock protein B